MLVFAEEGEDLRAAEAGGADHFGADELIQQIQGGWLEFDATIAVPSVMRKVGRVARILGPRGLMPSPKAGTVVQSGDIERAVRELKAGRVEFRNDRTGNLHVPIGKASFGESALQENAEAVLRAVQDAKPSGLKGIYLQTHFPHFHDGARHSRRIDGAELNEQLHHRAALASRFSGHSTGKPRPPVRTAGGHRHPTNHPARCSGRGRAWHPGKSPRPSARRLAFRAASWHRGAA